MQCSWRTRHLASITLAKGSSSQPEHTEEPPSRPPIPTDPPDLNCRPSDPASDLASPRPPPPAEPAELSCRRSPGVFGRLRSAVEVLNSAVVEAAPWEDAVVKSRKWEAMLRAAVPTASCTPKVSVAGPVRPADGPRNGLPNGVVAALPGPCRGLPGASRGEAGAAPAAGLLASLPRPRNGLMSRVKCRSMPACAESGPGDRRGDCSRLLIALSTSWRAVGERCCSPSMSSCRFLEMDGLLGVGLAISHL
mmetsp:Transcript_17330/g.40782  ORF Transcript_17330/g.40782 Transcript_17330/m.40782 type:complete len:250 (+) Transcript_17330:2481-3230(+)